MAETLDKITIKDTEWHKVMEDKGFVTIHSQSFFYFAYSENKPVDDTPNRMEEGQTSIENPELTKLWIRTEKPIIVVTPNKE